MREGVFLCAVIKTETVHIFKKKKEKKEKHQSSSLFFCAEKLKFNRGKQIILCLPNCGISFPQGEQSALFIRPRQPSEF